MRRTGPLRITNPTTTPSRRRGYVRSSGFTYGAVLVLHTISTLSSFKHYVTPFEGSSLMFFTAWPMLAACLGLYLLRELDTLGVVPAR